MVFQFRSSAQRLKRAPWLMSTALHAVLLAIVLVVSLRSRPRATFFALSPPVAHRLPRLPPSRGTPRGHGPSGGLGVPAPSAPAPAAALPGPTAVIGKAESKVRTTRPPIGPLLVVPGMSSDTRIFPGPRNSLPREVADALYSPHDTLPRDTVVTHRLRAMVDSLNHLVELAEREHKAPSWTTDIGGKTFGMDSANIYIAGIKIPTPVLALLGSNLPQGNFDESMHERQIADMRRDILQAAQRAQTMDEFRRYVREERERKQAERDAVRRQRGDTVHAGRDTVHAVP